MLSIQLTLTLNLRADFGTSIWIPACAGMTASKLVAKMKKTAARSYVPPQRASQHYPLTSHHLLASATLAAGAEAGAASQPPPSARISATVVTARSPRSCTAVRSTEARLRCASSSSR